MKIASWLLMLLQAAVAEPRSDATQLLFAQEFEGECRVSLWDPADRTSRVLERFDACPERLLVSGSPAKVFYISAAAVMEIPVQEAGGSKQIAELPDLTFGPFATKAFGRPLTDYEAMMASTVMKVRRAGILPDGTLWIHVGLVMAGDDDYDFLVTWVADEWVVDEFVHCERFASCGFAAFAQTGSTPAAKLLAPPVWHEQVRDNPHFVRDERVPSPGGTRWSTRIDRHFSIDDEEVLIQVWTGFGPDTGRTYTAGIAIRNEDTVEICTAQCSATLTDRYLLARRFWGGTLELYDVATGESVFGALKFARWAAFPSAPTP